MRKLLIFLFAIVVTTIQAQTSEPVKYQLRTPTLNDYLQMIAESEISCEWRFTSTTATDICSILASELFPYNEELSDQPYDLLWQIYDLMNFDQPYANVGLWQWNEAIIQAWVRENQPDLIHTETLSFADYTITVTPRDFSGDGQNEYLFYVESPSYTTYLIFKHDGSLVRTALPVASEGYMYWMHESGNFEELMFEDVTADGIPEWLVAYGGYGGGHRNYGELSLLSWEDDEMVFLTGGLGYDAPAGGGSPATTYNLNWKFENLDEDEPLEFIFSVAYDDNWYCKWTEETIFHLEDRRYQTPGTYRTLDKSFNCAIREAENMMFEGHYAAAAQLYQYAFSLVDELDSEDYYSYEVVQYTQIRMALAYGLSKQYPKALEVIESIPVFEGKQVWLVDILSQAVVPAFSHEDYDVLPPCVAAYNVFVELTENLWYYDLPTNIYYLGSTVDSPTSPTLQMNPPSPALAGCDAPTLIDERLRRNPVYSGAVVGQLEALNISVETSLHVDLNQDGFEEWLVWTEARIPAMFFTRIEDNSLLLISRPSILRPDEFTTVEAIRLPDDTWGVVRLVNDVPAANQTTNHYEIPLVKCPVDNDIAKGVFELWTMQNGELKPSLVIPLCETRELSEVLSENGEEIEGWSQADDYDPTTPTLYRWDEETRTYLDTNPLIEATALASIPTASPDASTRFADGINEDYPDYLEELLRMSQGMASIDEKLALWESEINAPYLVGETYMIQAVRYQKVQLLRELDRKPDLLQEYIALYDTDPESIWGKLAALYLEPIE